VRSVGGGVGDQVADDAVRAVRAGGGALLTSGGVDIGLARGDRDVPEQCHDLTGTGAILGEASGVRVAQRVDERARGAAIVQPGGPEVRPHQVLQAAALQGFVAPVDEERNRWAEPRTGEAPATVREVGVEYHFQRLLHRHRPGLAALANHVQASIAGRPDERSERQPQQLRRADAGEQQRRQDGQVARCGRR